MLLFTGTGMSAPYDNAIYSLFGKKFIEKLCTICFPLFVFVYCLSQDFPVFSVQEMILLFAYWK